MTELKTLRDIYRCGVPKENTIREEAIKWVKYLIDRHNHIGEKFWMDISPVSYQEGTKWEDYDKTLCFIKHFFNLTEEELGK